MHGWTSWERRWGTALLGAMLPAGRPDERPTAYAAAAADRGAGGAGATHGDAPWQAGPRGPVAHPGLTTLDLQPFWTLYAQAAPPLLRLGLRASVWLLTWLPPLLIGRPRPFHRLAPADQDRFLARAAASRLFLLRQLVTTIKLIAAMAYLRDPGVRARFGVPT